MLKMRIESINPLPAATEAPAAAEGREGREGRVTEKRGKGRHAEVGSRSRRRKSRSD